MTDKWEIVLLAVAAFLAAFRFPIQIRQLERELAEAEEYMDLLESQVRELGRIAEERLRRIAELEAHLENDEYWQGFVDEGDPPF